MICAIRLPFESDTAKHLSGFSRLSLDCSEWTVGCFRQEMGRHALEDS